MTPKKRKTTTKKKSSTSFFSKTIKGIFKSDPKTIERAIKSSNVLDLIDSDHDLVETNQEVRQVVDDSPDIAKTPRNKTSTSKVSQSALQRKLVLTLSDNSRFSLDDLLLYWQQFVDPMVDWNYLTRKKSQAELAADLVRKVTQLKKLNELQKALDEIL
jgi:2-oxo-4-hydroxy-4-carboxy--5-ureidoimidazoline (OHCU) decarboxylase